MPTVYNTTQGSDPLQGSYTKSIDYRQWDRSPRVNGKLVLKGLPFEMQRVNVTKYVSVLGSGIAWRPIDAASGGDVPPGYSYTHVDNMAYNRHRGRLFKGSASLGVTLASWKQSRDMIVKRSNSVGRMLDSVYSRLSRDKRRIKQLRREREPSANQVLETEFGWRPLIGDVHAALGTVCSDGIPPQWVRGVGREVIDRRINIHSPFGDHNDSYWSGSVRTTYSTKVEIDNPNTWLLNRLGLINPATVVWDLIPWSFVVNMFVNVNALINSVTDEVGLIVTDRTITRTRTLLLETSIYHDSYPGALGLSVRNIKNKSRETGVPLKPRVEVKIPELNWELALIASALVVQKFKKINNLIRLL